MKRKSGTCLTCSIISVKIERRLTISDRTGFGNSHIRLRFSRRDSKRNERQLDVKAAIREGFSDSVKLPASRKNDSRTSKTSTLNLLCLEPSNHVQHNPHSTTVNIVPLLKKLHKPEVHGLATAEEISPAFALIFEENRLSPIQAAAFLTLLSTTSRDKDANVIAACAARMRDVASPSTSINSKPSCTKGHKQKELTMADCATL